MPSPGHTSAGNHVTFQFPRLSPAGSTPSRRGLFQTNRAPQSLASAGPAPYHCDEGDVMRAHKNAAAEARENECGSAPHCCVCASSLRLRPSPRPAAAGHAARCAWRRQVLKRCEREAQLVASQQTSLVCARLRCSVTTRSRRRNRLWPSGLQYNARHMQIA